MLRCEPGLEIRKKPNWFSMKFLASPYEIFWISPPPSDQVEYGYTLKRYRLVDMQNGRQQTGRQLTGLVLVFSTSSPGC